MTKQRKIIVSVVSIAVLLIFAVLFFIIPRGSDLTIEAPAPPREVITVLLPPPIPSIIAVKADLPIQDVKILAESALRDYLNKPIQRKDGAIESFIKLNSGPLTMASVGHGAMSVSVPLQFNGWAEVSKKILGKVIRKRENIEGQATALLTLTPTLNPNWHITAKIVSDISIQKAELKILGLTVSIRRILTKLVKDKVLPKLEEGIVKYIANIDIKTRFTELWTRLHEPIVLSQDPPIVLVAEPLEILAQRLSSDGKIFSLSFGIKTYIHANIGNMSTDAASAPAQRIGLPDINFVDALESGYHIVVPIEATYTALENFAKPYVEKAHKFKGVNTLVENLSLYGSGSQLVAGLRFSMPALRAKGQLYLTGIPMYDVTTMSISVTEFDYALTTQNLLLDIAEFAGEGFSPNLRATVEDKLTFPLEDRLNELRERLLSVIAEHSIGSYVLLRGTVDTITPEVLYLTQTGVYISFRLQGNLACEMSLNSSQASH